MICRHKLYHFMVANLVLPRRVTFSLRCYVALLRMWRRRCFHGINAMILMPQIFDVTANENARYKRNELECYFTSIMEDTALVKKKLAKTSNYKSEVNIIPWYHWNHLVTRIMHAKYKNHPYFRICGPDQNLRDKQVDSRIRFRGKHKGQQNGYFITSFCWLSSI